MPSAASVGVYPVFATVTCFMPVLSASSMAHSNPVVRLLTRKKRWVLPTFRSSSWEATCVGMEPVDAQPQQTAGRKGQKQCFYGIVKHYESSRGIDYDLSHARMRLGISDSMRSHPVKFKCSHHRAGLTFLLSVRGQNDRVPCLFSRFESPSPPSTEQMTSRFPINIMAPVLIGIPVLALGLWLSLMWNHESRLAVGGTGT